MKTVVFLFLGLLFLTSCATLSQNKVQPDHSQQKDDLKIEIDLLEQRLELEKEIRESRESHLREWVKSYVKEFFEKHAARSPRNSLTCAGTDTKTRSVYVKKRREKITPEVFYRKALDTLLKKRDFGKAERMFKDFIKMYPDHKLIPNCYYWLGECYYSEKKYPKAILTFKEVPNRFPKSPKAPDALLKIGYSYWNLNQIDNAKFYLNRLTSLYPDSVASSLAKKFLKKVRNESKR